MEKLTYADYLRLTRQGYETLANYGNGSAIKVILQGVKALLEQKAGWTTFSCYLSLMGFKSFWNMFSLVYYCKRGRTGMLNNMPAIEDLFENR